MLESTQNAKPAARRRIRRIAPVLGAALTLVSAASVLTAQFADADTAAASPSGVSIPGDQAGWKVTFADDFTGPALNEAKWGRYSGVPGSGEGALWRPDHVQVDDGTLVLRGDKAGEQWVTGGLSQAKAGSQKYGRFDVRFRMPRANGIGYAILLYPQGGGWPPEIDMAEDAGGLRMRTMTTSHWAPGNQQEHAYVAADFSQWHTVSVEWTAEKLTYLLDGKPYGSMTGAAVPQVPMWLGIQTQWWKCVTSWGNCPAGSVPANVNMEVDWVVRYAADPTTVVTPTPTATPTPTPTPKATPTPTPTPKATPTPTPKATPTPKVTPKPTPTPAAKPLVTSALKVSKAANRSGATALNGALLDGKVYLSAVPSSTPREVRFYLDNPTLVGAPTAIETFGPFDLAGGTDAAANPLDLATLAAGPHTLTAVTVGPDGRTSKAQATFTRTTGTVVKARAGVTALAKPLAGQTVFGAVSVTAQPVGAVREVRYYIDDTKLARKPVRVDNLAPFDLVAGASWNTAKLTPGRHILTVATVTPAGRVSLVHVPFVRH
jgi:beta-glucanase (GH16 family)